MSYNAWLYVDANPVNYTDPSGFITEQESGTAEVALQLLKLYQVNIVKDWGYPNDEAYWTYWFNDPVDSSKSGIRVVCNEWMEGHWSLVDLLDVVIGVQDLAISMGGPINFQRKIVGPITISRANNSVPGLTTSPHSIEFWTRPDSVVESWSVVHEFAHVWDWQHNRSYSRDLEVRTGGHTESGSALPAYCENDPDSRLPGCNKARYFYGGTPAKFSDINFNRSEDFAESVAAYVYPSAAETFVANQLYKYYTSNPTLYNEYAPYLFYSDYTKTPRWRYVRELMK